MKKKVIKSITLIAIGALLVGVPVGAATYISSRDIEYTTEHNENITNVNEALDDLISNVNEIKTSGTATSSDILSGKTAYVKGNLITGTRTAQNNTYRVLYHDSMVKCAEAVTLSKSFTSLEKGKLLVVYTASDASGSLPSRWTKTLTKNGNTVSVPVPSALWAGDVSVFLNVEAGDKITVSSTMPYTGNHCNVVDIYAILVS